MKQEWPAPPPLPPPDESIQWLRERPSRGAYLGALSAVALMVIGAVAWVLVFWGSRSR